MRTTSARLAALALPFLVAAPAPGGDGRVVRAADVILTADEALALAFPGATVSKRTVYLTEQQRAAAEERLGESLPSGVARPYEARDGDGALVGVAWFDTHTVRTKRETLMTAVHPDGTVVRVEVLAFAEPRRYLPGAPFYGQFDGEALDDRLVLGGDVRNVAGATMTARATVDAARRALALHGVLYPVAEPEPAPEPDPVPRPAPPGGEGRG